MNNICSNCVQFSCCASVSIVPSPEDPLVVLAWKFNRTIIKTSMMQITKMYPKKRSAPLLFISRSS
ncbi:MAG: hypothetical protein JW738_09800 [Actinobacteria bacterium]|nr:hypothetical protein [Actinomycetota bacterium]